MCSWTSPFQRWSCELVRLVLSFWIGNRRLWIWNRKRLFSLRCWCWAFMLNSNWRFSFYSCSEYCWKTSFHPFHQSLWDSRWMEHICQFPWGPFLILRLSESFRPCPGHFVRRNRNCRFYGDCCQKSWFALMVLSSSLHQIRCRRLHQKSNPWSLDSRLVDQRWFQVHPDLANS